MRVSLGPLKRFSEGELTVVDLRSEDGCVDEAVVWRWGDELYAVRNYCTHQGAPMCDGRLVRRFTAEREGGGMSSDGDVPVIRCPWHGWEYDPCTGRSIADGTIRLRTWRVIVDDGNAFLELRNAKRTNVTAVVKLRAPGERGRS